MALRMQDYFIGRWETDHDFTDNYKLIEKQGGTWTFVSYIFYSGLCCIERGDHTAFIDATEKLEEVDKAFDFSLARALRIRLLALGYIKFRQFDKLNNMKSEGIQYLNTTTHTAMLHVFHSLLVLMYIYQEKPENARDELSKASEFGEQHKRAPIYRSQFLIAKIRYMLMEIEKDGGHNISTRSLLKLANQLIKLSGKMVANLSEAYLLKTKIYQRMDKHGKALQMLQKSIFFGETYKSLPELSRSYFETGKFLADPNNKYKELNGHNASHYLDKARTLFEEMDLQWDLEELRKFVENKGT
jgi:hypothetical protein